MNKRLVVSVVVLMVCAQQAWAARTPVHEAAESQEYGRKAGGMIGRGVLNVATSFVDLLVNVVNETRSGPPVVGTLVGVAKGVGCTGLRALSGGVDLVTFWVPGFNGFPVSDSYENCLALSATPAQPGSASSWPSTIKSTDEPSWAEPSPAAATPTKEEKPKYKK